MAKKNCSTKPATMSMIS